MLAKLWRHVVINHLDRIGETALTIATRLTEVLLLFIAARITIRILSRMTTTFLHARTVKMDARRRDTMESLLDNLVRYIVYFIFGLLALGCLQLNLRALLAGAGIAGLTLGFGAQNLIKDVLTGFFILFEDQYAVGDVVKINDFSGTVITIGLRLTRVQAWTGEIEVIPNGQIQQVTNYSKSNSVAVIDVGIAYEADLRLAMNTLRDVMEQLQTETDDFLGNVQVLGIQSLRESDLVLRVTAECRPTRQVGVQRLALLRIKEAFERQGLEISTKHPTATIRDDLLTESTT